MYKKINNQNYHAIGRINLSDKRKVYHFCVVWIYVGLTIKLQDKLKAISRHI